MMLMRKTIAALAAAILFALPARAQQVPTPINAPATVTSGNLLSATANRQQGADSGIPAANVGLTVGTISDLQALGAASSNYASVLALNYATPGDNGGGVFRWNSSSTASSDGCTIFPATGVTTGRWIRDLTSGQSITTSMCGVAATDTTLTNADAACVAYGYPCVLDVAITTTGDHTLSANWQVQGGTITHSTHVLTFNGPFCAPHQDVFDAAATGAVTFPGGVCKNTVDEAWFGVKRNNSTNDAQAYRNAIGACGGYTLLEGAGISLHTSWSSPVTPPTKCAIIGQGAGVTIDSFTAPAATGTNVITQSNPYLAVSNLTLSTSSATSYYLDGIFWGADHLYITNVDFTANITDNGTSYTSGVGTFLKPVVGSTEADLKWRGGHISDSYAGYGKTNSDTSVQSRVWVEDAYFSGNYGGDLQFNSPNGSQSDIKILHNTFENPVVISAASYQWLGVAVAFGDDIIIDGNKFTGNYYDAIHIEGATGRLSITNNTGTVSTDGISLLSSNLDSGAVWYAATDCVVADNRFVQNGATPITPVHAGFPNFGIGWNMQNGQNVNPNYCNVHDNIIAGSGFGAGYAEDVPETPGATNSVKARNQFIGTAIGMDFVGNGGSGQDVEDNVCNATPICVKGYTTHMASLTLVNFDQTQTTTKIFSGVNSSFNYLSVDSLKWQYPQVAVSASGGTAAFSLLRLGSTDRFGGNVIVNGAFYGNGRSPGGLFNGVSWDGTTFSAGTEYGTNAQGSTSAALSKANNGGTDYLTLTITNSTGVNLNVAPQVTESGFYFYYGN